MDTNQMILQLEQAIIGLRIEAGIGETAWVHPAGRIASLEWVLEQLTGKTWAEFRA